MTNSKVGRFRQYAGELDSRQAASAMKAARLNSIDLLETAEILFDAKRFAHSVLFSILAIEESGKIVILQAILLRLGNREKLWRAYRLHRAKTEQLNTGILARLRAEFPKMSLEEAKEIAARGPTPDDLELAKQLAVYADCLSSNGDVACHLPREVSWQEQAWDRLWEARAIVRSPRDRSPEELEVWAKHMAAARGTGKSMPTIMREVQKELVEKGYVKEGSWDAHIKDAEDLTQGVKWNW